MPSYFPENNSPKADDTEVRSLQKINDLLSGGITVSVGEVEVKNDAGNPVPITVPVGSTATTSTFTSISSAQILPASSTRKLAVIFNSTANVLYVLLGDGTASSTNYTVALGEKELVSFSNVTTQIKGIYATSGTAYVTSVS